MKSFRLAICFLLALTFFVFGQKIVYDLGYTASGSEYTAGATLDTVTGTATNVIFYFAEKNWYPFDVNPLFAADTGGTVKINSDRFYIGTLYTYFDANLAADSIIYTIKAYPGVLTSSTSLATAKWGTAVTLETVRVAGDYMSINNVYVHASKYKHYPPEVLKIEFAPVADPDNDDLTAISWRLVYPVLDKKGLF